MANDSNVPAVQAVHNDRQKNYFRGPMKRTMVPRDTRYLRRHVDEVLRVARVREGERVLEVGCGMGRYTLLLAERGLAVEGLDLSPVLLDRLRSFNEGRHEIPLHCADIAHPPKELEGRFDTVLGFFMLHHVHDLRSCFEGMKRLLKPGGKIVFAEPNPLNILYYFQILLTPRMTWKGDGGIIRMRPQIIFRAMRRAGFGGFEYETFGFFPPFLVNRPWGARLEAVMERVSVWSSCLPFHIFKASVGE